MAERIIHLPPRAKDVSGKQFGRLTVIRPVEIKRRMVIWLCRCECGGEAITSIGNLNNMHTRSCGCLRRDAASKTKTKHGMSFSSEYNIWNKMRSRCENTNNIGHKTYGGRGIAVCDRWNDFETFLSDMGPRPSGNHSIDRIDVDGDYTPENCRWATQKQQQRNRTNNHTLTHNGETMCIAEWVERTGFAYGAIHSRLKRGWTVEKTLTQPLRHMRSPAATSGIDKAV